MQRPAVFSFVVAGLAFGCGSERTSETDASSWPGAAPGPAGVGPGVRVFSGTAATLSAARACTAEEGAEGDRWCAFIGLSSADEPNLFVVNVSQIMAGVPVSCDAPDPNCLLLTNYVRGSSADWHPTFFAGDTLVYYDQGLTPYVWRPGMEAGRLLASNAGGLDMAFCSPAPSGMAVACLAIPFEQPNGSVIAAELYVGAADGESEPLLAPTDSVIAGTLADTNNVHRFSFGFPASGYVAWSSRETPDGPEILKLERVDDPESQITVASDVHKWEVSADGSTWLWLSAANDLGIGVLQTALFPEGTYPTDVLGAVRDYDVARSGSVAALTLDWDAVSILDPIGTPEHHLLIDSEVGEIVSLSDQGDVAYAKRLAGGRISDLLVSSLDGTDRCVIESSVSVSLNSVHFAPEAGTVLWARSTTEGYDAYHSRLADCSTVAISPNVVVLGWMGSGHAVFIDAFDARSSSGALRFRKIANNGELHPDPATLIAEQVDTYATWGPNLLLYTINAGTDQDGAYVRAFGQ